MRPKTEAVRLGKHDALKTHIARGESVERIFQHSGIWLNSFSHRGFLDIGSEDQFNAPAKETEPRLIALRKVVASALMRSSIWFGSTLQRRKRHARP